MKLIYLHQYFNFPDERGSTRSYDLASSFAKKGIEVHVITATGKQAYKGLKKWKIVEKDNIIVHYTYLPYDKGFSYLKRIQVFLKFIIRSSRYLMKNSADLVLATSTPLTIGIPALYKYKRDKTPFVFEVRDVWPEAVIAIGAIKNKLLQRLLYKLEELIYKNAVAIVPLSIDMKSSIDRRYPQFSGKTKVVIPNISEVNRFQSVGEPNQILKDKIGFTPRFSMLYAGTFGKVNGIRYVIDLALLTLPLESSLTYILIGVGNEKEEVKAFAADKGLLNENVFILEPVKKEELPSWYGAVSMGSSFVIDIPELWANSANKFFDTLAAGKPIVINHEGWQADTIRKYNVGYVLPPTLTEDTAKDFIKYVKNQKLHMIQSKNALDLAKQEFGLEIATQKYLQIFNKIGV